MNLPTTVPAEGAANRVYAFVLWNIQVGAQSLRFLAIVSVESGKIVELLKKSY